MRLFGITKAGLLSLTLSVGALWGCVGLERASTRQATRDYETCLRNVRKLREIRGTPERKPARGRLALG